MRLTAVSFAILTTLVTLSVSMFASSNEVVAIAANLAVLMLLVACRPTFLSYVFSFYIAVSFLLPIAFLDAGRAVTYAPGLTYVLQYNCAFSILYVALTRRPVQALDFRTASPIPVLILLTIFASSAAAIGFLFTVGEFRVGSSGEAGPLLGVAKAAADLIILPILLLGAHSLRHARYTIPYIAAALIAAAFGALSGSRWSFLVVGFAVFLIELHRNRQLALTLLAIGLPVALLSFPFLLDFRNNGYDLAGTVDRWSGNELAADALINSVLGDRLNYIRVVQFTIERSEHFIPDATAYLNNIVGLIPRLIWPDKPAMSLDLNQIARELGLIHDTNLNTSIGLSVYGESYYLLQRLGVFVALFQALLYSATERLRSAASVFWRIAYLPITLVLVVRDSYVYLVPLLATYTAVLLLWYATIALLRYR
jgi:hypothetical protein